MAYSVAPGWEPLFDRNGQALDDLLVSLGAPFEPPREHVFAFSRLPLQQIKVVILGQDPYPASGVATGRAFEVGGLSNWHTPFRQVSLKNIVRALYGLQTGASAYTPWREILPLIGTSRFPLLAPNELFASWEHQGVLLLNRTLTCATGKPGSHRALWEVFGAQVISYLLAQGPGDLCWFLWGADAASALPANINQRRFVSRHPMLCSPTYEDDFLKNPCFRETAGMIRWLG